MVHYCKQVPRLSCGIEGNLVKFRRGMEKSPTLPGGHKRELSESFQPALKELSRHAARSGQNDRVAARVSRAVCLQDCAVKRCDFLPFETRVEVALNDALNNRIELRPSVEITCCERKTTLEAQTIGDHQLERRQVVPRVSTNAKA